MIFNSLYIAILLYISTMTTWKDRALIKIVDTMFKYQRENDVTRECIANVSLLVSICRDLLDMKDVEAQAVVFIEDDDEVEHTSLCSHHIVMKKGNRILDPSYEIWKKKGNYFTTAKDIVRVTSNPDHPNFKETLKECIKGLIKFQDFAKMINAGITLGVSTEHFNGQKRCIVKMFDEVVQIVEESRKKESRVGK